MVAKSKSLRQDRVRDLVIATATKPALPPVNALARQLFPHVCAQLKDKMFEDLQRLWFACMCGPQLDLHDWRLAQTMNISKSLHGTLQLGAARHADQQRELGEMVSHTS